MKPQVVFLDPNDGIDAFASEADEVRPSITVYARRAMVAGPAMSVDAMSIDAMSAVPVDPGPTASFRIRRVLGLVTCAAAGVLLAIAVVQLATSFLVSRAPAATAASSPILPGRPLAIVAEAPTLAPMIDVNGLSVVYDAPFEAASVVVSPPLPMSPPLSQILGPPLSQTPSRAIETPPPPSRVAVVSPAPSPIEPREGRESRDVAPVATPLPVATPAPVAATPTPTPSPARLATAAAAPVPAPPPVAAPVPAPAPVVAAAPPVSTVQRDVTGVQTALARYRSAFSTLDAAAAAKVWPTVNEKNLSRAFDRLATQEVSFDGCAINVNEARADANCNGTTRYVPRVGSHAPRVDRREWRFSLVKVRDDWQIGAVDVR